MQNHAFRVSPWSHKPALLNGRFGNCKIGAVQVNPKLQINPVLPPHGVRVEKFAPFVQLKHSESVFLPGNAGPLGLFKKFAQKEFVLMFRPVNFEDI